MWCFGTGCVLQAPNVDDMWDTVEPWSGETPLSHDMPCAWCGHAAHRYLPCDRECDCEPALEPVGAARA